MIKRETERKEEGEKRKERIEREGRIIEFTFIVDGRFNEGLELELGFEEGGVVDVNVDVGEDWIKGY